MIKTSRKDIDKIIQAVIETIDTSLKPSMNSISKGLDYNSDQMKEITAVLKRIEYKIDLLLSSQALDRNLLVHKKKIIKS